MCVHSAPLERGLMRANNGNACCCFPFINRSTLAHAAFHQQQSAISAGSFFSPPSITSSPYLLPFNSFIAQMEWLFSIFLNLYLSSPYLAGLSFTTTSSSMNTNMCKCPNYCSMTFQWAGRKFLGLEQTDDWRQEWAIPQNLVSIWHQVIRGPGSPISIVFYNKSS